ncbi:MULTISPECIES: Lrp/AsnC family transcriptional regulator [Pseudoxanthomonas]|uniref:Lrp/AsnC family transcriptional regulator n=1 Tax=Pseudoxanthomonas winnipegensis TaxID=2480810 RepID=A0A4Q8L713_9GAMM|nr:MULTISPECIES: Lrp/AsnC family transcriptional regulator [Pseudoxanthomonas]TAA23710.1 Lrp/AsnC family transcriptional regulator [Pseudoxanthomonas winnipegensis]TMN17919.1 Lrp/AsnC family transcriptional regulator [Pseudoxanthomonas sp. X-1]UAY76473.1 Lrp/AsnC family transcriptional regulator [Pseudoxanthomonas sp. X-1]
MSSDVPPETAARPLRIDPGLRLDQDDLRILQILSRQARVTKSTLASEIGLSITPTWERVRKLEAAGLIRGYRAVIDWQRLFKTSQVLVQIVLGQHTATSMRTFAQRMADAPEVAFCYATGGGIDYIAMIECSDIAQYQAFMEQLLGEDLGIARYSTYVVTKAIRAPGERPLPALDLPRDS